MYLRKFLSLVVYEGDKVAWMVLGVFAVTVAKRKNPFDHEDRKGFVPLL